MLNVTNQELSTALEKDRVILASGSAVRANILRRAGVAMDISPAGVDEDAVKQAMKAQGAGVRDTAMALAELKATRSSARHAGRLVIGADQILECDGAWFDKPENREQARGHLTALRGRRHQLVTAACVALDGAVIWRHIETARLTMRDFSDDFMDRYLEQEGEVAMTTVGAYRIEDIGLQLFAKVEGDHFVIQGLPLLPLLDFLRARGVLAT
jgi:septum formation protein